MGESELKIYWDKIRATFARHQVKVLVNYGRLEGLEGDPVEGIVIAEFPSFEAAKAWFESSFLLEVTKVLTHLNKRSPKGNRQMRRIFNQAANAAVKHKGSIFEIVYRRLLLRLGHNKTIGAVAIVSVS
ncbi:MAG TPA: DUF1330 domain-containing protein [Candidatus Polarisedimenticolia bacterium]|nr:DUF1330 domain-containing protein [Candidatus Polarisedimenticolia bacterium]